MTGKKTSRGGRHSECPAWAKALLTWFDRHQRAMPWRRRATPYRVWVSEIMLQQTQVKTALPYFRRFMRAFPSLRRLARADLQDVLKAWEGLGYYARARNLHRAARTVVAKHGGRVPADPDVLRSLPGVGEYTAGAIASIGYHRPVVALDGNVLRVMARFRAVSDDIATRAARKKIRAFLEPVLTTVPPSQFNQALMELGALVCKPATPDCVSCPLRRGCLARRRGLTDVLPKRARRARVPHHDIGIGIVRRRDGHVLIAQRKPEQMLGGLWEFPGGKRSGREALRTTVRREVREETGLNVSVGVHLCTVAHAYSHFRITLHAFLCRVISGRPYPKSSDAIRWVAPNRLSQHPFPAANRKVIQALHTHLANDKPG